MIGEGLRTQLEDTFPDTTISLIEIEINNRKFSKHREFSDNVKSFAQTLYYLSPRAYKYARRHFILPHKSTLRRWMSCDGAPGWTAESFCALENLDGWNDCGLILDAMHIKRDCQFVASESRIYSYTDFGTGVNHS